MKKCMLRAVRSIFCIWLLTMVAACSDPPPDQTSSQTDAGVSGRVQTAGNAVGKEFVIYAGSEMSSLEPMIKKWAQKEGHRLVINYKGSIDMMRMMADSTATQADAYWPAHSIWFILGDTGNKVKNKRSIMVSPIVAGLKKTVVERLGWDKQSPTLAEFLEAAQKREFRYAKTSSTQSNSGALFHLAAWWAFAGKPETWTMDIVNNKDLQEKARKMEATVAATSGSSGWLKSKMIKDIQQIDGMINYEAMISEANIGWTTIDKHTGNPRQHPGLLELGHDPLHVVYLADATMMADHPLGYVDKGDTAKAKVFDALQKYLLTPEAQTQMIQLGRRNRLLGMDPSLADEKAFNPDLGFDVHRVIAPIHPPREAVLTAILDLYQEEIRKPSATFWVIDDSGSMYKNGGKEAVQKAMAILLTPARAREYKLQPTPKDFHVILPFSSRPGEPVQAQGNDPAVLSALMEKVTQMRLGGGTDMYAGIAAALELIKHNEDRIKNHFPAVAVLSDGISKGSLETVAEAVKRLELSYVPIHSLSFGSGVDEKQLKDLADAFGGRYFSGKKDVADAFRKMKGYN